MCGQGCKEGSVNLHVWAGMQGRKTCFDTLSSSWSSRGMEEVLALGWGPGFQAAGLGCAASWRCRPSSLPSTALVPAEPMQLRSAQTTCQAIATQLSLAAQYRAVRVRCNGHVGCSPAEEAKERRDQGDGGRGDKVIEAYEPSLAGLHSWQS